MSPEQAEGRLDAMGPASDVYSLGATLYTLLVGRPPFQGGSPLEVLRMHCEVEPDPPSRLDPTVPRDVEAICVKALDKRPERRYASARAMADDLKGFLAGRPISARMPGVPERVARWVRRRRAPVAMSLLAVAAVAVVSFQQVELLKARRNPIAEGQSALRRAINRSHEADLRNAIAAGETNHRIHPENREGKRALASGYHRLGDLLVNTDRLADSTWAFDRAVTLLQGCIREKPGDVAPQIELADVYVNLGEVFWALGRRHDAQVAYRENLIIRDRLVADHPDVASYRDDRARTLIRLNQFSGIAGPGLKTRP
jgi:hypothetical protein